MNKKQNLYNVHRRKFIYILSVYFLLLFYLLPSMGNSPTNSQKLHHRKLSRINHHILQCASEIINKDSVELQLIIATPNQKQANQWQQKINQYRIPKLQSQVLFLPKSVRYEGAALCGSGGIIKAIYSAPPLLLSEQLENRMAILQPFFQSEIWYLLYVLIYAASEVHLNDLIIGDIRPKNIFLFDTGEIAITCLASFLEETPNYIKSLRNRQLTFLAPEQIDDLINNKTQNKDPSISQNFSIGLTLLSLMLLHDEQKLYFSSQSIFDVEKFSRQLACLAHCQIYSVELKKIVLSLLHAEMDLRINSQEVFEILKPHQKRILNFDDFNLNMNSLNQQTKSKLNCIKFSDFRLGSSSTIVRCINEYQRLDGRLSRLRPKNEEVNIKNNDDGVMDISKIGKKLSSLMIVPGIQDHLFTPQNYKSEYNLNETKKQALHIIQKYQIKDGDSQYNESDFIQQTNKMNFFKSLNRGSKSVQNFNQQYGNTIETKSHLEKSNKNKNAFKEEQSNINESGEYYKPQSFNPQYIYTFSKKQDKFFQDFGKSSIPIQGSQLKTLERQTIQTDNRSENMFKDFKRLQQMGRQAKSIKNMTKYTKKSNKKIDYESILKNIDEQLKSSRQKFPNMDQSD